MSEKNAVPGKVYLYMTGKCTICKSPEAQEISWRLLDGYKYQDIIADYAHLKLSESMLSKHKRSHFMPPGSLPISESGFEESDHGFVDALRHVGFHYLMKARDGVSLSMTEARIVQTAANSITGRAQIEDAQAQALSLQEVVKKAMRSRWKHRRQESIDEDEAMRV